MIHIPLRVRESLSRVIDPNSAPLAGVAEGVAAVAWLAIGASAAGQHWISDANPIVDLGAFAWFRDGVTLVFGAALATRSVAVAHATAGFARDLRPGPLRQLASLAAEVDATTSDWESRRGGAASDEAWASGREELRQLADRVAAALQAADDELAVPLGEGAAFVVPVGPVDLARAVERIEATEFAVPSPIRVPPSVERALESLGPWLRGRGRLTASFEIVARGARWLWQGPVAIVALLAAVLAEVVHIALEVLRDVPAGQGTAWWAVVIAAGFVAFAGRRSTRELPPLGVEAWADPRADVVIGCREARAWNANRATDAGGVDIARGQVLRRRVAVVAASLDELGPLGTIDAEAWDAWRARTGLST